MNSQEPQNQQNLQTVWNVPPVIRWEWNNNYGMNAHISGIITEHGIAASIDPRTDRKTKVVTYTATVKHYRLNNQPSPILPHDISCPFTEQSQAKEWCEEWITYAYRMLQLAKASEVYRDAMRQEQQRNMELQAQLNDMIREQTAQQFREDRQRREEDRS